MHIARGDHAVIGRRHNSVFERLRGLAELGLGNAEAGLGGLVACAGFVECTGRRVATLVQLRDAVEFTGGFGGRRLSKTHFVFEFLDAQLQLRVAGPEQLITCGHALANADKNLFNDSINPRTKISALKRRNRAGADNRLFDFYFAYNRARHDHGLGRRSLRRRCVIGVTTAAQKCPQHHGGRTNPPHSTA